MIRGTTAQFTFTLPYPKNQIDIAEVKFWQSGNTKGLKPDCCLPMTKTYEKETDANGEIITNYPWHWINDDTLVITLGQQETLTFCDKYKACIQLRIRTTDGLVTASAPQKITVYPAIWDNPLEEEPVLPTSDDWVILDGDTII